MRKFSIVLALVASLALAGSVFAAPASKYILSGSVVEAPAGTFTIDGSTGGAFWLKAKSNSSKAGNLVLSFVSTGDVAGGAPRLSIPIDTNGDSTREGYAFLDAAGCGGIVGTNDANVSTTVSTQNAACAVNALGVDYANWDAFVAAVPTARVAPANTPFIIADVTGTFVVTDVHLR